MSRAATIPTRRSTTSVQPETREDIRLGRLFEEIVSLNSTKKSTSKTFLKSLQSIKLTKTDLKDSNSCSICMDDFAVDSFVDQLPCKHLFHKDCIVEWLKRKNTCPLCRFKLPVDRRPAVPATLFRSPSVIDFDVYSSVTVTTFRTAGSRRVNQRSYNFDLSSGSNSVGDVMVDSDGDTLMGEVVVRDADGDIVMVDA